MKLKSVVLRTLKWLAILVIAGFLVKAVADNWQKLKAADVALTFRPGWLALSLGLTWIAYLGLVEGWLRVIRGWGQKLRWWTGARIWILSSFGKYIPGRVWAIAGMAAMSERAGVRGSVATAAAVVMQILAVGAGIVVTTITVHGEVKAFNPWAGVMMIGLGALALASLMMVGYQPLLNLIWKILRRVGKAPNSPSTGALVEGVTLNLLAWVLYGAAFWALSHGILLEPTVSLRLATGVFAAAYVGGLVMIFVPGGIGVRDGLLVALLQGTLGIGPAVALAAASRLILTMNEIGAALPFVFFRRKPQV